MKIAVTGANGKVGRPLVKNLTKAGFDVTSLDLPDNDVSNLDYLVKVTKGHDAIIHMAWAALSDNFQSGKIDPVNTQMIFNAYQAALINKIPRVIMASSNHAHRHDLRDKDGKIRASINPTVPDSPYGAEKVFMEALGRFYAVEHGLQVIAVRIGNVNEEDSPKPSSPEDPSRWLSHRDLGQLVRKAIEANFGPAHFEVMYGVSRQAVFDWSNTFGYEPQDKS